MPWQSQTQHVAKATPEQLKLLLAPPKYLDYKYGPLYLASKQNSLKILFAQFRSVIYIGYLN